MPRSSSAPRGPRRSEPRPGLTRAGYTAYNRWLADFCAYAPVRLIGDGLHPLRRPRRRHRRSRAPPRRWGCGARCSRTCRRAATGPPRTWTPLWRTTRRAGLAGHFHVGGLGSIGDRRDEPRRASSTSLVASKFNMPLSLGAFVFGGVLRRAPRAQARLGRRPDRLDPVLEVLHRPRLREAPLAPERAPPRAAVDLHRAPDVVHVHGGPARHRGATRVRHRPDHVVQRLPALRDDLAAQPEDHRRHLRRASPRKRFARSCATTASSSTASTDAIAAATGGDVLDHLIKGGTVVDGTGAPARTRRRRCPRRPHRRGRRRRRAGARRRSTPTGSSYARASSTRTRTTTRSSLGPVRHAVERARRHDRDRRQLRLHARAARARGRRLHPPHDGQGRGHAARRARARRAVGLADLRRVPRPPRRQRSASTPASSSATARCAATSWAPTPSATRRPPEQLDAMAAAAARVDRRRRPRVLDRRCRTRTPTATADPVPSRSAPTRRGARAVRRRRRARGHHARGASSTAASTASATTRSTLLAEMSRRGRPPAQLERAHRRLGASRAASSASSRPSTRRGERGGARRRAHHADARPDEHELRLRTARCSSAARLGRRARTCPSPSASTKLARPRGAGAACSSRRSSPRPACSRRLADLGTLRHRRHVLAPANEGLKGRVVARHRGRARATTPFDTLARHRAHRRPAHRAVAGADRRRRRRAGRCAAGCGTTPTMLIGGSDAGAHLDRMCGAPYTTRVPRRLLRGRKLVLRSSGPCS